MLNVNKNLSVANTRNFVWDPKSKTFSAEISELCGLKILRVWDDACDVGFVLQSHRTGDRKVFVLSDTKTCPEGDTMTWEFVCHDRNLSYVKVTIFND